MVPMINKVRHSGYDRTGIEKITTEMFGVVKVKDAITPEVMIVAYEYNSHEPRIFSKYTANQSEVYDVSIKDAAEASSAAPIYFDPKVIGD